jgi:D-aspartate ligase
VSTSGPPCLVIGDDYRALGALRSLGRRGIEGWVVADRATGPAQFSRYCSGRLAWGTSRSEERAQALLEIAARPELSGAVAFPTEDRFAELVARNHEQLSQTLRLTVPPWAKLEHALDKGLAGVAAQAAGVDIPRTWRVAGASELEGLALDFPVVLKPATREDVDKRIPKAWRADDRPELVRRFAEASRFIAPADVLIQELIPGGGESQFSYAALMREGQPVAELVARRTRQYPIDFGNSSTYVEVVDEPQVAAGARRVLAQLGWTGLVEVEFKRDARDGRYALLDINPRLWTWHPLGAFSGMDFPYLAWCESAGLPVPPSSARVGASWKRGVTDALAAMTELRAGHLRKREYVASLPRRKVGAVYARDDLRPALADVPIVSARLLRAYRVRRR